MHLAFYFENLIAIYGTVWKNFQAVLFVLNIHVCIVLDFVYRDYILLICV